MVAWADAAVGRYQAMGYDLTVRQLFYIGVTENRYANTDANYKSLARLISEARLAGRIDWDAIKDRARITHEPYTFASARDALQNTLNAFKLDKWKEQPCYVEVAVEKQALEGVLAPVCDRLEVRFTANKGYGSQSLFYELGKRIQCARDADGKRPVIIYCGDLDPSGWHMSHDVQDRISLLSNGPVDVVRIALNRDQVDEFDLPENPVKETDTRKEAYKAEFGDSSWELDAIPPDMLGSMVEHAVLSYRDDALWASAVEREAEQQEKVQDLIESI